MKCSTSLLLSSLPTVVKPTKSPIASEGELEINMRAGICTVQQALTAEAASIVKQALSLARRRGHAQVTPLHVASAMLATSAGLLRKACLQSHSHPLQFRALELCFNVALNRLPASTSGPLLGPHSHHHPSLSNALVAAFKRAQAHQRRGSIENQQQPILALKIELEHLVISILDDPSVSRVMREAGFSSTQVKNKVEQTVSMEVCSQSTANPVINSHTNREIISSRSVPTPAASFPHQFPGFTSFIQPLDQARNEDVTEVLNRLVNKSRNTVVMGESLAMAESVVKGLKEKLEKGQVSGELRFVQFISLPLFSLRNLPKDEVEQKLVELRGLVKGYMGRGVVLYLGDLKGVSEFWSEYGEQMRSYNYCAVEHIIMEIKRLVSGIRETGKLFLLGIATFQTYIRCKTGYPSLEAIWELHPFTVSVDHLALSLNLESNNVPTEQYRNSKVSESGVQKHQSSFMERLINFEMDAQSTASSVQKREANATMIRAGNSSGLPPWLQQYKEESKLKPNTTEKEVIDVKDLYKTWNSFGSSTHKPEGAMKTPSLSPASSTSAPSRDREKGSLHLSWPIVFEPKQSPKQHQFWTPESGHENEEGLQVKPDLLSNPNSSPNSASTSEALDEETDYGFMELNDDNFNILSNGLEKKVPWQKEIIPEMVNTILQSRASKEVTWLFFLGADSEAKHKIAKELARLIFGSQTSFASISLSNFSTMAAKGDLDEQSNKRSRDELGGSYLQRFAEALNENPHRVFFMEDIEQVDRCSKRGIKKAMESGSLSLSGGEKVRLKDAIVVFNCETFACATRKLETDEKKETEEKGSCVGVSLDLNIAIEDSYGEDNWLDNADGKITFRALQEL